MYRPTEQLVLADNEQKIIRVSNRIIIQSAQELEFNYGGAYWFKLGANTLNVIDSSSDVTLHAPMGGGAVTCVFSVERG